MAITQTVVGSLSSCQPTTLLALVLAISTFSYYVFFRKPNLNMPVEVPDPGPEGVFNTLTRMYEKVGFSWSTFAIQRPFYLTMQIVPRHALHSQNFETHCHSSR